MADGGRKWQLDFQFAPRLHLTCHPSQLRPGRCHLQKASSLPDLLVQQTCPCRTCTFTFMPKGRMHTAGRCCLKEVAQLPSRAWQKLEDAPNRVLASVPTQGYILRNAVRQQTLTPALRIGKPAFGPLVPLLHILPHLVRHGWRMKSHRGGTRS